MGTSSSFWRRTKGINAGHHFLILALLHVMLLRSINAGAFLSRRHGLPSHRSRHHNIVQTMIRATERTPAIRSHSKGTSAENHRHRLSTAVAAAASDGYSLQLRIPTPEDMEDVGGLLSVNSRAGDVILLDGDLGAGKTCFSRGFVRGRTGTEDERVTSPTYLLSNAYAVDGGSTKVYHMDLYRLSGSEDDLAPLDLDNVFRDGISLIEWPTRLGDKRPSERLDITLTIDSTSQSDDDGDDDGDDSKERRMKLEPHGEQWVERLQYLESEGYMEDLIDPSVED